MGVKADLDVKVKELTQRQNIIARIISLQDVSLLDEIEELLEKEEKQLDYNDLLPIQKKRIEEASVRVSRGEYGNSSSNVFQKANQI